MIGRKQPPKEPPKVEPKAFDDFEMRLGDMMRGERATLGKSLLDIQRDLKIKATYIAAIENADVSAFETPGFIAGYVRSYARYLGMDPEQAFDIFCAEANFTTVNGLERGKTQPSPGFQRGSAKKNAAADPRDSIFENKIVFAQKSESVFERVEPGAIGSSLVLLALVGAIGYGGWAVLREIQQVKVTPVDQAPGVAAQVDPLAGPVTAFDSPETSQANGMAANQPDALDRLYRPQALSVPVMVARDGPIFSLDPGLPSENLASAPQVALAEPAQSAPALAAPKVLADAAPEVMLVAVREAWVRVRAADGSVLLEKTLQPGDTYVLPKTEEPASLRAGAAGGVFFMVNGQTYGPAGDRGAVVDKIALAPDALTQSFAQVDTEKNADGRKAVQVAEAALIGDQNGVSE